MRDLLKHKWDTSKFLRFPPRPCCENRDKLRDALRMIASQSDRAMSAADSGLWAKRVAINALSD